MSLKNKQIFIVDDDESVCRSLNVLLSIYGFPVDAFKSGEDFFKAVPNSAAGCLILDIHMPEVDGWEVLRRIIESGSRRPVILISADQRAASHERALKAGAVGYLQKPFDAEALISLINRAFEQELPPCLPENEEKNEDQAKV